jgi:hypothetical protein
MFSPFLSYFYNFIFRPFYDPIVRNIFENYYYLIYSLCPFDKGSVTGCTTVGEIVTGKMLDNLIAAMDFNGSVIEDVKAEVLQNIKAAPW